MSIVIDDGHPLSYEHEAEERMDLSTGTVTLVCDCGSWSGEGTFDTDTWETEEPVVAEWTTHVYEATGRDTRTCALESCNKAPRPGSRHCSYGHNLATAANRVGAS